MAALFFLVQLEPDVVAQLLVDVGLDPAGDEGERFQDIGGRTGDVGGDDRAEGTAGEMDRTVAERGDDRAGLGGVVLGGRALGVDEVERHDAAAG